MNTTLLLSSVSFVTGGVLLVAHVLSGRREPLAVRLAAIGCGFLTFLIVRRSVFAGLVAGESALLIGGLLFPA